MPIERHDVNLSFEIVPRIDSARLIQRDVPPRQSGEKNGGRRDGQPGARSDAPEVPVDVVELGPAPSVGDDPAPPPVVRPDVVPKDDPDRHLDIQV